MRIERAKTITYLCAIAAFTLALQFVCSNTACFAGPKPVARALPPPTPLTIIDWNIQVGSDEGLFRNGWKQRKHALIAILKRERPDILCVQEAMRDQIAYILKEVPGYSFVGVGRDDGKEKGEHCAIFYTKRIELLDKGTFWLSETPDSPKKTWDEIFRRICTWARVRDSVTARKFCIFNTHFPVLSSSARDKATDVLMQKVLRICPRGRFLLAGDFNCGPGSGPWKEIHKSGFTDAEWLYSHRDKRSKTFHDFGKGRDCLDAIFVSKDIHVLKHDIIDDRVGGVYPSDHFGTKVRFEFFSRD